jgi:hypothetical protein
MSEIGRVTGNLPAGGNSMDMIGQFVFLPIIL